LPGAAKIGHPASLRSRFGFNHYCSKINLTDRRSFFMPMTDYADENPATGEIELNVEELEAVIAPKLSANHNETIVNDEVELSVEEMEEVIAPKLATNHNETLINNEVELAAEEVEEVIAPKLAVNHNETIVNDEVELNVEELEETIAPTPSIPIPPPLRNY
jgi:hypothetical protein